MNASRIRLPLFVILGSFVAVSSASAKSLQCAVKENGTLTANARVESVLDQKVAFATTRLARAFITEKKDGPYLVEAFLPDYEARIYAQGTLKSATDQVVATIWTRDALIELACALSPTH